MKNTVILAALAAVTILPAAVRAGDETAAEEPAVAASGSFSFGKPKAVAEAAGAADGGKADAAAGRDGDEEKKNAFAELFSGQERAANAEKFLSERLADFPGNVVEAFLLTKEDGSPDIELDDGSGHVFANAGVRVNPANYAAWVARLQEVLGAVCQEQEKTNLKFGNVYGDRIQTDPVKVAPPRKPAVSVTVATPGPEKVRRSTWPATVYWLEEPIWKAFLKALDAQFPVSGTLEVVLADEDGEPVCSKVENLKIARQPTTTGVPCFKGDCVPVCAQRDFACILPAIAPNKMSSTLFVLERKTDLTATFRIDLGEIPEEDMSEVRGFQVKLEYRKPAPKN